MPLSCSRVISPRRNGLPAIKDSLSRFRRQMTSQSPTQAVRVLRANTGFLAHLRPDPGGGAKAPPHSAPEVLEPRRGKLGVAHCVADRLMAQIRLQGPRIDPIIGELEAGGVTQHVRMDREAQPCSLACALHQPQETCSAEGRPALADED